MKRRHIALFALLFLGAAGAVPAQVSIGASAHLQPADDVTVDIGFFYDDLAPYGHWVDRPSYGWAWSPYVDDGWRPYTAGHWLYTDCGPTWVSAEPFGWATYHYGRWYFEPGYGWLWVPGTEWAPAWVSWQYGADYVGWAPLPPAAGFSPAFGLRLGGLDLAVALVPEHYVFVEERYFFEPALGRHVLPPWRNRPVWRRTRNVTRYGWDEGRVVDWSLPVRTIERDFGLRVPVYRTVDVERDRRHRGPRIEGRRAGFFRPDVVRRRVAPPPERLAVRKAKERGPRIALRDREDRRDRGRAFGRDRGELRAGREERLARGAGREKAFRGKELRSVDRGRGRARQIDRPDRGRGKRPEIRAGGSPRRDREPARLRQGGRLREEARAQRGPERRRDEVRAQRRPDRRRNEVRAQRGPERRRNEVRAQRRPDRRRNEIRAQRGPERRQRQARLERGPARHRQPAARGGGQRPQGRRQAVRPQGGRRQAAGGGGGGRPRGGGKPRGGHGRPRQ